MKHRFPGESATTMLGRLVGAALFALMLAVVLAVAQRQAGAL